MKDLLIFILLVNILLSSCRQKLPYQDASLQPEERAIDLVQRLTLEEKSLLMLNSSPAVPRLGIKKYRWWNEALHGVARKGLATVFPQAIGMGASFNDSLLHEVFTAVSSEARVKDHIARRDTCYKQYQGLTFWTPNINIFRDPRWGRGQETYGEDPYLTGQLGMAVVRGLQGPENSPYDKAHACAKHYAVHSGPEWNRHSFNVEHLDPRDLWETYLPAFKDLVQKAGVKEVMCAYNRFEGSPCCNSDRLLMQILRDEWNYKGLVVSDCGAIYDFFMEGRHGTHKDKADASSAAVLSGTDLECGNAYMSLPDAVRQGKIKEADLDRSVIRLLKARFELGEMDETTPWDAIPDSVLNCQAHQSLALRMAHESMTLLQNKNGLLPLKDDMTVALVGPNANDSVMQWGNYNGLPCHTVTLYEALRKRLPECKLIYVPGCDRVSEQVFTSCFDQCSTVAGNGFDAIYWDNSTYDGTPIVTAHQATPFRFNTDGAIAFAPNVPLTSFSAIYRSILKPQKTGEIEFRIQMRGAFELFVDGCLVASKDGVYRKMETVYRMPVEVGRSYDIELKYKQHEDVATLLFDLGTSLPVNQEDLFQKIKSCDVVVFAGGIAPSLEGEEMDVNVPGFKGGDRTDIELPAVQRRLLKVLKAAGKKVVFVNFSGSAVGLEPETQTCDAILQAWYPGEAGGTAVADVLYGDYNPAGRLPVTFYKNVDQLPDFQDYSMKGRTYRYFEGTPLFPFGYGLSYTTFAYGKAEVKDGCLLVPVTNTGSMDGDEVVQLYLNRPDDANGPRKTLRAFKRVHIPTGATRTVSLPLTEETFNWWDTATNTVHPLKGSYKLFYGGSSDDNVLQTLMYQF